MSGVFFFPLCSPSIKNCHNIFLLFVKLEGWFARQSQTFIVEIFISVQFFWNCWTWDCHVGIVHWWLWFHFIIKVHSTLSMTVTVLLKLWLVSCNMFLKLFYCMLEQTCSEQNINVYKLWSSLFLEISDVSIGVILLLLAHLKSQALLRPDENEAFEYRIITPTFTLKYHQNLI